MIYKKWYERYGSGGLIADFNIISVVVVAKPNRLALAVMGIPTRMAIGSPGIRRELNAPQPKLKPKLKRLPVPRHRASLIQVKAEMLDGFF